MLFLSVSFKKSYNYYQIVPSKCVRSDGLALLAMDIVALESTIWTEVFGRQATREVKLHAVYCVMFVGMTLRAASIVFGKGKSSICRWVKNFKETGDCERKKREGTVAKQK
jgi:hypothetical protein